MLGNARGKLGAVVQCCPWWWVQLQGREGGGERWKKKEGREKEKEKEKEVKGGSTRYTVVVRGRSGGRSERGGKVRWRMEDGAEGGGAAVRCGVMELDTVRWSVAPDDRQWAGTSPLSPLPLSANLS